MNASALLGPLEGVGQGLDAALLPHEVGQQAGPVFEGEGAHGKSSLPQAGGTRQAQLLARRRPILVMAKSGIAKDAQGRLAVLISFDVESACL